MATPTVRKTAKRIKALEIQGARNVAKAALKSLEASCGETKAKDLKAFRKEIDEGCELLSKARATEPALRNGITYIKKRMAEAKTLGEAKDLVKKAARLYASNMSDALKKIIEIGERRITEGMVVMTHCHSSTVTKILIAAKRKGKKFSVICTETRPRYQGRKTAEELVKAGIPTTMIVDSAARKVMNDVDMVIVGADAVTASGVMINKIGTSQVALVAKEARTKFAVACETYKFDPITLAGEWEPIEERNVDEVWKNRPKRLKILNPAFDATPPNYIDFIITEMGIINPFEVGEIIRDRYGGV